ADYGLVGERDGRYTGVWVGSEKVAAIGVKVSAGVTSHGFALNVDPIFEHWAGIIPCGIRDRGVTSLKRLLGDAPGDVRERLARHTGDVLGLDWQEGASLSFRPERGISTSMAATSASRPRDDRDSSVAGASSG